MIGARVASARRRRGLTQRELASAAGVSIQLVRMVEQQGHDSMRGETRRKLAAVLGVDEGQLTSAPPGSTLWSERDERDRELGARVRSLLAEHGIPLAELSAVFDLVGAAARLVRLEGERS